MLSANRILVIGSGASGKTTFSLRLSEQTGLPLHHLDALYWSTGWQSSERNAWRAKVNELVRAERWIIDGSYGDSLDIRMPRADLVVFFDLPRYRCLWNLVKRRFKYAAWTGRQRPGMPAGCPERIYGSFVKWVWQYPSKSKPDVLAALEQYKTPGARIFILRSYREMEALIRNFAVNIPVSAEV
jgi:adenylate kinase family enzyme